MPAVSAQSIIRELYAIHWLLAETPRRVRMTCLSDYLAVSNQGPCHALIEFIDVLTEPLLTSYRPETKKPVKDYFVSGNRKEQAAGLFVRYHKAAI